MKNISGANTTAKNEALPVYIHQKGGGKLTLFRYYKNVLRQMASAGSKKSAKLRVPGALYYLELLWQARHTWNAKNQLQT